MRWLSIDHTQFSSLGYARWTTDCPRLVSGKMVLFSYRVFCHHRTHFVPIVCDLGGFIPSLCTSVMASGKAWAKIEGGGGGHNHYGLLFNGQIGLIIRDIHTFFYGLGGYPTNFMGLAPMKLHHW